MLAGLYLLLTPALTSPGITQSLILLPQKGEEQERVDFLGLHQAPLPDILSPSSVQTGS